MSGDDNYAKHHYSTSCGCMNVCMYTCIEILQGERMRRMNLSCELCRMLNVELDLDLDLDLEPVT